MQIRKPEAQKVLVILAQYHTAIRNLTRQNLQSEEIHLFSRRYTTQNVELPHLALDIFLTGACLSEFWL